jgi:predicted GNAT family acetyltransferase
MAVVHQPDRQRFVRELPEGTAELAYMPDDTGTLNLYHTFVPPAARGNGVAATLVEAAIEFARGAGVRIKPSCPYVRGYLSQHPDTADVVEQPDRR